ncbi:ABC-type transport auxiliary lipoprotein family protein [Massilia pseudoviolaceinigra]|uniref:ABC-type transport auxiliary lipoprotein family protein n=1 Tax=Massilia pseudoviolaceinigra TaxID=3057165 RepID=UPI0027BA118D|nr:ABC-type transport auxiliary lipoprotein family protein [Massilia sp. CCM 9206]
MNHTQNPRTNVSTNVTTNVSTNVHASLRRLLLAASTGAALLLAGCASEKPALNTTFDFGPATNAAQAARAPIAAVVVGDVTGSAALDSERMYYRLNYSDPLQARAYANSRWSATPLQMVTQRLKSRIAQSGAKVLSVSDASDGVPILRLEIDDFTHNFDSQAQSHGQLVLRASLFQGHKLIDQKTFDRKNPATSMDAGGGARALAGATDTVAADVIAWLATLPLKKE